MEAIRETCVRMFSEAFGDPERLPTTDGLLYRWVLRCIDGTTLRITLDSPEFTNMAHIIVSDTRALVRTQSLTMNTREEIASTIELIRKRLAERRA